jgi:hypothetical protein
MKRYRLTWNPSLHPRQPAGTSVGGQFRATEVKMVKPTTPCIIRINGKEYNPDQPRVPAGNEDGGQWTAGGRTNATNTPAFRKWFGNSKVVDAQGNPQVIYHGTSQDFTGLSAEKIKNPRFGWGFYFSDNPDSSHAAGEGGRIIPVYLRVENPYVVPAGVIEFEYEGYEGNWQERARAWTADAKRQGYDGVVWRRPDGINWWVAFEPNQAKSIFNSGEFGPGPELMKDSK